MFGTGNPFWFPPSTGLEHEPVLREATPDELAVARPEVRSQRAPLYAVAAGVVAPLLAPLALGAEIDVSELWLPAVVVGVPLALFFLFLARFARDLFGARVTSEVVALDGLLTRTDVAGGGPHTHALGDHRVVVPRPWYEYLTDRPVHVEAVRVAVPSGAATAVVVRADVTGRPPTPRRTPAPARALGPPAVPARADGDPDSWDEGDRDWLANAEEWLAGQDAPPNAPGGADGGGTPEPTLSVTREVQSGVKTPVVLGRWWGGAAALSAGSFFLASLLALFAAAGGYGGPDSGLAWGFLGWAAASLAAFAAFGVPYLRAERRMHRLYEGPGVPSAADFARARRRVVGWAVAAGPALMLPVVALGLAPWWAALPVGLVAFVPAAFFVPAPPGGAAE